ncbi:hypothetical protein VAR608DRAFT_3386 [Variovorax sp. HW608]|uniref:hypothetical protein n=1 Tax=Variovorax sp. HW608 TaxID=1034889 RepID=UPI00081FBAF0|nr:hypothetical protein [Variovorax sp. HW608]SCK36944.1 hypothetical protein VAR608DRAFT_3386 [Variovorax sp. HW608]
MMTFLKPLVGGIFLVVMLVACGGGSGGGSSVFGTGTGSSASSTGSSSESTSGSPPGTSPSVPGSLSLAQQIEQLERKGGYPTLDRSSDIAGPDSNKNGVRDDIEAWINTLNVTDVQRAALMQKARALQQTLLVDLADKGAVQRAGEALMASTNCGASRFKPFAEFIKPNEKIEAMTANTRERAERYMQYNKARSGSVTTLPNYDTCEP